MWQYVRELLAGTIGVPVARVPREVCVKPENVSGRKMTELASWVCGFYIYCVFKEGIKEVNMFKRCLEGGIVALQRRGVAEGMLQRIVKFI